MSKTITYYYPNINDASNLRLMHDPTGYLRGIYLKKVGLKKLIEMELNHSNILYLLYKYSSDGEPKIFIDRTTDGFRHIESILSGKQQWDEAMLFVSDDQGQFTDRLMNHVMCHLLHTYSDSKSYILLNQAMGDSVSLPAVDFYERPMVHDYYDRILDLLSVEGFIQGDVTTVPVKRAVSKLDDKKTKGNDTIQKEIDNPLGIQVPTKVTLAEHSKNNLKSDIDSTIGDESFIKYYYPTDSFYKARLYVTDENGPNKRFVLEVGSVIRRPLSKTREYKNSDFYEDYTKRVDRLLRLKKIKLVDSKNAEYEVIEPIGFKRPSAAACLVAGTVRNGWAFFNGLARIR